MAVRVADMRGRGRGEQEMRHDAEKGQEPIQLVLLLGVDHV